MVEFAVKNAWLVAVLPFLAACIISLFTLKNPLLSSRISRLAIVFSLFLSCLIVFAAIGDPAYVLQNSAGNIRWFTSGNFDFTVSWKVDAITAMMLVVVTLISSLVQLYSREYMEEYREKGFSRYFAELSLFSFSMLLLVLTDNFLILYAGWELVGVSSFLLIGFFFEKEEAAKAAKKAFLVNRIGDFGFLIGILLVVLSTKTLNFDVAAVQIASGAMSGEMLTIAVILLFFGAIGKSGQFPLHVWLPDAMEGPTPVSALIHAATMVAAGVYMVAKIMAIFAQATFPVLWGINALGFVAIIGGITAIMAAFIAITQTDIKKVLAYSTVSQLGFMILTLGMYSDVNGTIHPVGYTAGVFHLFTHAFFKAMLFLGSGSVIHATHTQDIREMGGLRKAMPVTAYTFLIGTAAISGFPLTAGFWSKDEMLTAIFSANLPLFVLACLSAVLTTFYMFRLYFITFEGAYRGHAHPHEPGWRMKFPLIFLAVPSLFIGFIGTPWKNLFHDFIHFTPVIGQETHEMAHHGPNWLIMGISVAIFVIGFVMAYLVYGKGNLDKARGWADNLKPLYQLSYNKLYIDEAYLWIVRKIILLAAKGATLFDKYVIDLLVNSFGFLSVGLSHVLKLIQSGKVQQYGIGVIASTIVMIFIFTNAPELAKRISENSTYLLIALGIALIYGIWSLVTYVKKRVFS